MEKELWVYVKGYEGLYKVSNLGNVFGVKRGKALKQFKDRDGYLCVGLHKDGKLKTHKVHRLVALAFPEICGEWFEGAVVNHKDENIINNVAANLEFCTVSYNNNYGSRNINAGLSISKTLKGRIPHPEQQKKVEALCPITMERLASFVSVSLAARMTQISEAHISDCCNGKRPTAGKFVWRFTEQI